ncbi:MAG: DUF1640 domain-containing protein [Deltaproteobacteria bacterium]|nr:MAG: DUF1640 domain-containing protein [Deltaproteobacteria bacterium]
MKKSTSKKALKSTKKVSDISNKSESVSHYTAVLVEDLKSEFRAVAEGLLGFQASMKEEIQTIKLDIKDIRDELDFTRRSLVDKIETFRTELKGDIQDLRTELKGDIQDLRTELKGDIQDLRTELKGDMQDLRTELKGDMQDLRTELKGDIASLSLKVDQNTQGISELNEKMDYVAHKVQQHDEAIIELQSINGIKTH